jgi:hypothetical protein
VCASIPARRIRPQALKRRFAAPHLDVVFVLSFREPFGMSALSTPVEIGEGEAAYTDDRAGEDSGEGGPFGSG